MHKRVEFHKVIPETRVNKQPSPQQTEKEEDLPIFHFAREKSSDNNQVRNVTVGESQLSDEDVDNIKKKIKRFRWRKNQLNEEVKPENSVDYAYDKNLSYNQLEQLTKEIAELIEKDIDKGSSSTFG